MSLDNLGKRYNAVFNVDTDAQEKVELFLREDAGIHRINQKKADLYNELKNLLWHCKGEDEEHIKSIRDNIFSIENITAKNISESLSWNEKIKVSCNTELSALANRKATLESELEKLSYNDKKYESLRSNLYCIERTNSLLELLHFDEDEVACINSKILLVKGTMGTGKTQLLATAAKRLIDKGQPVLLYLGQTFTSSETIEKQMINNLHGLNDAQTLESLLQVMEEASDNADNDAVILIDAINESHDKEIWKQGINRLVSLIEKFTHIKLILSLRSGFEGLVLSDKIIEDSKPSNGRVASIVHRGLLSDSPQAVYEFVSKSGIPFSPEYYLQSDMSNPLFLTWFCQTYTGEESDLFSLISKVIENADIEASRDAGSQEPFGAMEALLKTIIAFKNESMESRLLKENVLKFDIWNTYGISNKIAYLKSAERYGVINTFVADGSEIYYIGYNMLEEYLEARDILDSAVDADSAKDKIKTALFENDNDECRVRYNNIDVFNMASCLYAIKYGDEPLDLLENISDDWNRHFAIEQYFISLSRRSNIPFDRFMILINKYPVEPRVVWNVFIENSAKKHSELNADGLTRLLLGYELNRRDYLWTKEINNLYEDDRIVSLAYYLEEGNSFSEDEEKIQLLLTLFAWMLSSSNRELRDRISKAMVEILKNKFQLCLPLLMKFNGVNDPYIIQRLYGIVFGAVMKRTKPFVEEYKCLTKWIADNVFCVERVFPDILLRDYARLIIERFVYEFPEATNTFDINKVRPPYNSEPIPEVVPKDYSGDEYKADGVSSLIFSMTFDIPVKGRGMYGDFGRYTFQSALSSFKNVDLNNVFYYALDYIFEELGYSSELFGEYDSQVIGRSRHDSKKTERIGKKYQWIAMYNILARISDEYKVDCWWDWENKEGKNYSGPWEPYVRDFDPTLNVRYGVNHDVPKIIIQEYEPDEFLPFNSSEKEIREWVLKESKVFSDFPERLKLKDESGTEWITLYHYNETKIKPRNSDDIVLDLPNGEQHIWTITTSYIKTPSLGSNELIELLEKHKFAEQDHNVRSSYTLYSREYPWSPAYKDEFRRIDDEELEELNGITNTAINVLWEEEFDASQDEATSFFIPSGEIIRVLGLEEKKYDGYYYSGNDLVAFDMKLSGNKQHELVIRKDYLQKFLKETSSRLFWSVVGEKQYFRGNLNQIWQRREGYFVFDGEKIVGNIRIAEND